MKSHLSILLESDTNELELLEFCVDHGMMPGYFGVNVAKVQEIIRIPELTRVALSPEVIAGTIARHGKIIPVINLAKVLGSQPDREFERIIILELNQITVGIMVGKVSFVHRLSWGQVETPPQNGAGLYVIALVKMVNRIILLLDFERILAELFEVAAVNPEALQPISPYMNSNRTILFVDDSSFIRSTIGALLRNAGFLVEESINGDDAWQIIQNKLVSGTFNVDIVITDVEMPLMDGLHLTSLIKKDERLNGLPVFIFSSMASDDNKRKWQHLGADGIITKPDLPRLVEILQTDHRLL
jgi:two-component system chemotaxis response regulator CheV